MSPLEIVFWGAVLGLAYTVAGYPGWLAIRAAAAPRPIRRGPTQPAVSVLIAARDEGGQIAARLENLLALDYPRDRLEILLGSDGSTDGTAVQARSFDDTRVRVFEFETQRGKAAVVTDLARRARGEILMFADTRQRFEPKAVRALIAPFADPTVGAVSGELLLTGDAGGAGSGVGLYWRYEKLLRRLESEVDSTLGVSGAIYAVRRSLFEAIPASTVLDDVWLPMRIARRGYRVVFEPMARAYDRLPAGAREEYRRKARTLAGNLQWLAAEPWVLDPRQNRLWLQTVSHKGMRLVAPAFLGAALAASLALAASPFYRAAAAVQVAFYAAALAGFALEASHRRPRLLAVPCAACMLAAAVIAAWFRFLSGRQRVTWERAAPSSPAPTGPSE
jgi:cellulose synthase/poly-beta-1,6-N-acetylglucosamine synthase-like glycosyltransferase